MGLDKVIIGIGVGVAKSTFRFNKAIDGIIKDFDNVFPNNGTVFPPRVTASNGPSTILSGSVQLTNNS